MEAITKCKYCNLFGKRKFIKNNHYNKFHASIKCDICGNNVLLTQLRGHYNLHKEQINNLRLKVYIYENKVL